MAPTNPVSQFPHNPIPVPIKLMTVVTPAMYPPVSSQSPGPEQLSACSSKGNSKHKASSSQTRHRIRIFE